MGRRPTYTKKEEMQPKIDAYFDGLCGEIATDANGSPVFTKLGEPCYIKPPRPPTVAGLTLALGFASRQTLLDYAAMPEFADTIARAKLRVEEYAEAQLYNRDGQRGAEFNLRCNFGWRVSDGNDAEGKKGAKIIDDI